MGVYFFEIHFCFFIVIFYQNKFQILYISDLELHALVLCLKFRLESIFVASSELSLNIYPY